MAIKRFDKPELARKLSICTLSLMLLFFGFFSNYWNVAQQEWFLTFQRGCESLVIGKMVQSRQDGILSAAGLLGAKGPENFYEGWISPEEQKDQYFTYINDGTFDTYTPYLSQTGGQGMLFSLLDSIISLPSQTKLTLFHMLTSLLTAIVLTLATLWFYYEFGLISSIFVICSMVSSQWLTGFGRNLFWSIWVFYLPMVAVMYFLKYKRTSSNDYLIPFGILIFVTVSIKCFINGFDYITTTLIMMVIPFIYYCILDKLRFRQFLKGTFITALATCVAIIFSLVILAFQISSVKGNRMGGFEHIIYTLAKRTHADVKDLPDFAAEGYTDSLGSSTIEVTTEYLKGIYIDLNNYLTTSSFFVSWYLFRVRFFYLIALFMAMSIVLLYCSDKDDRQRNIALVCATWASILAPLSWFIIFKAHSFIHTFQNNIVWQMPFTLFGFAVCGLGVKNMFSDLVRLTRRRT